MERIEVRGGPLDLRGESVARGASGARTRRLESTFFMINVVFLLLLFFIVAGRLDMNIEVSPPRSDSDVPASLAELRLSIDADGRLRLDREELTLPELARALRTRGRMEGLSVVADAGVDAAIVARVLAGLSELGIGRVKLVTLSRGGADGR